MCVAEVYGNKEKDVNVNILDKRNRKSENKQDRIIQIQEILFLYQIHVKYCSMYDVFHFNQIVLHSSQHGDTCFGRFKKVTANELKR